MNNKSLIVIVTYNSKDFIEDCLVSIAEQDYRDWQLVIVDNDSSDDTLKKIRHLRNQTTAFNADNFKLMTLKKNIGFARAVNFAVFNTIGRAHRSKKGKILDQGFDHLILLNPDIYLLPGALRNLVDSFVGIDGRNIGACGGLILEYKKDIVQHLSGKITKNFITYHDGTGLSLQDVNAWISGENIPGTSEQGNNKKIEGIIEADYVTGAFFATRFQLFTESGGFDRGYRPVYFEELDYCLKLKEAGWRIVSNMQARCRHFEGASVKKFSSRFYRHYHKNRIRCAIINLDIPEYIRFFIPSEIKWLLRTATKEQALSLLYAYFINKILLLYNLGVKIKNYFILNRIELK